MHISQTGLVSGHLVPQVPHTIAAVAISVRPRSELSDVWLRCCTSDGWRLDCTDITHRLQDSACMLGDKPTLGPKAAHESREHLT
mmetsp:Transcript_24563/g.39421  ORF Transcript_24563/g.39421 Transcript_24563/m.39421 type:complete len:85 (-) Transcript_24563:7-261(-)